MTITALPTLDVLTPTTRVFDAITARLDAAGFPKPDRAYVTLGDIDEPTQCSQFVVAARQVYAGKPGLQQPGPVTPHFGYQEISLEIGISYARCWQSVTNTGPIKQAKEDQQAKALLADLSTFLSCVWDAYWHQELADSCSEFALFPAAFIGPSGGTAGVNVLGALQLQ